MTNFLTLTRMRVQLTLRNKMFIFFSVIMPFGFFFLYAGVFAKGVPRTVSYYLGPVLALTVMGSFWGLSAALVMFREQGILRRFHVTPVTPSDMLASSVVANYLLTLPTMLIELCFAKFIFHVTNLGDLLALFVLATVGTVAFASLGLVVASVTNTMQETQVINQLLWLPLIFLSGATLPLAFLPRMVQKVALFLPATYLVNGLQKAIFLSVPIWKMVVEVVALGFWGLLTFFVSAQLFRWEPESKIPRRAKFWAAATAIPFVLLGMWELRNGRVQSDAQAAFEEVDRPAKTQSAPDQSAPDNVPPSDKPTVPHD